jgi:hypothetical protein
LVEKTAAVIPAIVSGEVYFTTEKRRIFVLFSAGLGVALLGRTAPLLLRGGSEIDCFGEAILFVEFFQGLEFAWSVVFLEFVSEMLEEERFFVVCKF